ncbi:MAG: glycosyltransferase family 4 protein [Candidatus Micrarchaeota archaeon]
MKALLFSDFSFPPRGGTERHVMGVADYLTEHGWEVHIISPAGGGEKAGDCNAGRVRIHKFDFPLKGNFLVRSLLYFILGSRLVWKYGIDVVEGFYTMPAMIATAMVAKTTGRKYIATLFEWELFDWQRKSFWKWPIARWAFGSADVITTIGPSFQRKMKKEFPKKDVREISNWVEGGFFEGSRPILKPSRENKILFMGRLVGNKGIYVLLKALSRIKRDLKFKLILAGPPIEIDGVKQASKKLGILERIEFRGFVPEKALPKLYRECDILAFPSILRGGMAFVVMEAMACGKPVACSDDIGLREGVGRGGIIVRKGDDAELARAIKKMLTDSRTYANCSRNALKQARTLYYREKVLGKYLKAYVDVTR